MYLLNLNIFSSEQFDYIAGFGSYVVVQHFNKIIVCGVLYLKLKAIRIIKGVTVDDFPSTRLIENNLVYSRHRCICTYIHFADLSF